MRLVMCSGKRLRFLRRRRMGLEARGAAICPVAACSLSRDEGAFAVGMNMRRRARAVAREKAASQI